MKSGGGVGGWGGVVFGAVLMLIAAPALVAQMQTPTDAESRMTEDPKAPGADAVYLYREEVDMARDSTETYYERIKVLTEKGKEMATVHWPYVHGLTKIQRIEGRTIHADGSIFPLDVKPEDLVEVKGKGVQLNSVVFTLPNVDVGSILEYRLKLQNQYGLETPTWDVQQGHFVHKAHYYFDAHYQDLTFATHLDGAAKVVRDSNTATLDIQDVPPLPDEDWMPPMNTIRWRVVFYQLSVGSGSEYWKLMSKAWATWVNKFIATDGGLKKTVAGMVSPGDSEEEKSRKIYAAVMKLENTDFSRKKSEAERKAHKLKEIKKAEDVWKDQAGGSDEIALLYVALARAAGLKAVPMQVVNRNRALFDPDVLSMDQLDDFIAVVTIGVRRCIWILGKRCVLMEVCTGSTHWRRDSN